MYRYYTFVKTNFMKHLFVLIFCLFSVFSYAQNHKQTNLKVTPVDKLINLDSIDFKALHKANLEYAKDKLPKKKIDISESILDYRYMYIIDPRDGSYFEIQYPRPQDLTMSFALTSATILTAFYLNR